MVPLWRESHRAAHVERGGVGAKRVRFLGDAPEKSRCFARGESVMIAAVMPLFAISSAVPNWVEWLGAGVLPAAMLLAACEILAPPLPGARVRTVTLAFLAGLLGLTGGATALVAFVGFSSSADIERIVDEGAKVLGMGGLQAVLAAVFLAAALLLHRAPASERPPRLLPLLDGWRVHGARGRRGRFAARCVFRGLEGVLWFALMLVLSGGFLAFATRAFDAHVAEELTEMLEPRPGLPFELLVAATGVMILLAPFFEEVVYRGFLQDRLLLAWRRAAPGARWFGPVFAIALTSAVWAVGHLGRIEPEWVKWMQILLIGFVLGAARLRLGLEACIVLHLAFNLFGGFFLPEGLLAG